MKTEKQIRAQLKEFESDERLGYPPANVEVNSVLALIQVNLEAKVKILKWVLAKEE